MPRFIILFLVILATSACRRTPANELAFLTGFRHTGGPEPDGTAWYRIYGDPATIRAAIPNAASAPAEVSPQGTQFNFYLPSGKGATLTYPSKKGRACSLGIDAGPPPLSFR